MEQYTDNMLKKYLNWIRTLNPKDIELSDYNNFTYSNAYERLLKPFGRDDEDISEFVYSLISQNIGSDKFIRPELGSYTVSHKAYIKTISVQYWENEFKTYLPEEDVDDDYVYELEGNGTINYWDGRKVDEDVLEDETVDTEIEEIYKND